MDLNSQDLEHWLAQEVAQIFIDWTLEIKLLLWSYEIMYSKRIFYVWSVNFHFTFVFLTKSEFWWGLHG